MNRSSRAHLRAIAVGLSSIALLAGCIAGSSEQSDGDKLPKKVTDLSGKTIHVLAIQDPFYEPLKASIPEFEKKTGAKVVLEGASYDGLRQKYTLDAAGGSNSYDVFTLDGQWTAEMSSDQGNQLMTLDGLVDRDKKEVDPGDMPDPAWEGLRWKDKTYAVPISVYVQMLMYRKDLWESPKQQSAYQKKYNAKLAPPTTWEEFYRQAEFFTGRDWNGDGKADYGTAVAGKQGSALVQFFFQVATTRCAELFSSYPKEPFDFTPKLDSPEMVKSMEFYKSLKKVSPKAMLNYEWYDVGGAFWNDQAVMVPNWSVYADLSSDPKTSKVVGKVGAARIPHGEGCKSPMANWGLSISRASENKSAAWQFVKWATSSNLSKTWAKDYNYSASPRESVLTDPAVTKKYPWAGEFLAGIRSADPDYLPRIPALPKISDSLGSTFSSILNDRVSVQKGMTDANIKLRNIVNDADLDTR